MFCETEGRRRGLLLGVEGGLVRLDLAGAFGGLEACGIQVKIFAAGRLPVDLNGEKAALNPVVFGAHNQFEPIDKGEAVERP